MKVFGASGHGKVLYDIARVCAETVSEFVDDDLSISTFCDLKVNDPESLSPRDIVIIGIGNNTIRRAVAERVRQKGASFSTLIHPKATIAEGTSVGEGTVIMAGVVVNSDVILGEHVILNTHCSIDHDCIIGDYAHISPGVTLCGGVRIGDSTQVGAGSTVIPGVSIGRNCMIGAGATVIEDIPDGCTAVGTPARVIKGAEQSLYIFGAGGFGAEVIANLSSFKFALKGVLDDKFDQNVTLDGERIAVCIGSSSIRKNIVERLVRDFSNLFFPNLIDQSISGMQDRHREVVMGNGNIICQDSLLTTRIQIGHFNIINLNCTIGHDCRLGNFVSLMPSVNLGGNVTLHDGVYVGANATILPGVEVGEWSTIGAGAVVTKNVEPHSVVKGVPAK